MIGLILKTGFDVSSTGFIKIVGDANGTTVLKKCNNWEYKAAEYDPETRKTRTGPWFNVTSEEINEWIKNS